MRSLILRARRTKSCTRGATCGSPHFLFICFMIFAHIQYPIIDNRWFLKNEKKTTAHIQSLFSYDSWIKNFGHVAERISDSSNCPSNLYFAHAHNAVKINNMPLFYNDEIYQFCRFRRLHANKYKVACDIGLAINTQNDIYQNLRYAYGYNDCCTNTAIVNAAVNDIANISLSIKRHYNYKNRLSVPLSHAGKHIAKLYAQSTSRTNNCNYVNYGKPTLVVVDYNQHGVDEENVVYKRTFYSEGNPIAEVSYLKDKFFVHWHIMPLGSKIGKDKIKKIASLRRVLLDISLEKEVIVGLYNFLLKNYDKPQLDINSVIKHINYFQEKLCRSVRYEHNIKDISQLLFGLDIENNRYFYLHVLNLSNYFDDINEKFVLSDFRKIFFNLDFDKWEVQLQQYNKTSKHPNTTQFINDLLNAIKLHSYESFWAVIEKYHLDEQFAVSFAAATTIEAIKELLKYIHIYLG